MSFRDALPALAALSGATLAALVAFVAIVLSKENKLSELRQQWIDGLRADLAEIAGVVVAIHAGRSALAASAKSQLPADVAARPFVEADVVRSKLEQLALLTARVRLRLNPREPNSALGQALRNLEVALLQSAPQQNDLAKLSDEVVWQGMLTLKGEWERVKRGEPLFRYARNIGIVVFVLLAVAVSTAWVLVFLSP